MTPELDPGRALLAHREALVEALPRLRRLIAAVDHPGDLWLYQWVQLFAMALEARPTHILELGRGYGNSTCAFVEAARRLSPRAQVTSLCLSSDWRARIAAKVRAEVGAEWFEALDAREGDILAVDMEALLGGAERVLVFWDAHGWDVAEVVLGRVLPVIASKPHVVLMHDLSDVRNVAQARDYAGQRLWRGNDWGGPTLRLGDIQTRVEQAIAAVDFTSRNGCPLRSADAALAALTEAEAAELEAAFGEGFSRQGHWFYFSLAEAVGAPTFPAPPPAPATVEAAAPSSRAGLMTRLRVAADIVLGRREP